MHTPHHYTYHTTPHYPPPSPLGYESFMYPNPAEMRKLMFWLVDRLPKTENEEDGGYCVYVYVYECVCVYVYECVCATQGERRKW
jgi:hypothetical protein